MNIDHTLETGAELADLIRGYEPDIFNDLAVCMRHLSRARRNHPAATSEIIAALTRIELALVDCALHQEDKAK